MGQRSLYLFSPVYNPPQAGLGEVMAGYSDLRAVCEMRGFDLRVLFVDDASPPETAVALDQFCDEHRRWASVEHKPANLGNADSIEAGYSWALRYATDDDIIGCCDGDGEHDPMAFLRHLRAFTRRDVDHLVGTIIYPEHETNWLDLNGMRFLGALQAETMGANGMFYIQSGGFQLHRAEMLRHIIYQVLPDYLVWYPGTYGEDIPRWGMHGLIDGLLAAHGAVITAAYLGCFGRPPNRTASKLRLQANAAMAHLEGVQAFMAVHGPCNHMKAGTVKL